jgi:hypothetical protein
MKRPYLRALSTGAIFGLLSMTPAFAQVAGNPGHLHKHIVYKQQYRGLHGYTATVPEPTNSSCGLFHDFNTSQSHFGYIAVCPLPFH